MCGISGFHVFGNYKEFDMDAKIKKITDILWHRGPDASGFWNSEKDKIYLGHRRLSILDLSDKGRQPMLSNNSRYVITFNGEIYNFGKLREELKTKFNIRFYNNTDTQVILELVSVFGIRNTLEKLEGMFALAIWDREKKSLFLTRDRFGEKPLFYYLDNNILVFSSELKSIKLFFKSHQLDVNYDSCNYYSVLGYIPAPLTIYKKVYKVMPAEILEIKDSIVKQEKYWNIDKQIEKKNNNSFEENLHEVDQLLNDSVKKMMVADVEVGCFLSGGVDSSVIATLMQKNSNKKIKTFTVGFSEKKYNEADFAKKIAHYIGSDHNEIIVSMDDMIKNIDGIIDQYDEPFSDSSCLPTGLISKYASKKVKVVLSGDGGDEIFLGYNRYLYAKKIKFLSTILSKGKRSFLKKIVDLFPVNFLDYLSSPFQKSFGLHGFSHKMMKLSNIINYETNADFYKRLSILDNTKLNKFLNNSEKIFSNYNDMDLVESVQRNDIDYYLLNDILTKVDRASMTNSLEVRSPFLDHNLVEKVFTMPMTHKMNGNQQKLLLKELLGKYLPKKLFIRPKMGFGIPIEEWLKQEKMIKHCDNIFFNINWSSIGYEKKNMAEIWTNYKKFKNSPASKIWSYLISGMWINKNMMT
ncbi:asparagine synthase (glutamine-hydrolyzing) [Rickettsiales bacterium]|nr:asparagine synthase (glutamine-hydrolyzing) [Rickettsiales bacterium]